MRFKLLRGRRAEGYECERDLPFQIWFDSPSYDTLSAIKLAFFTSLKTFYVSFTGFSDWLRELQYAFRNGFAAKYIHNLQEELQGGASDDDKIPPFDEETLGGTSHLLVLRNR